MEPVLRSLILNSVMKFLNTSLILLFSGFYIPGFGQGPGFDVPKIEDLVKIPPSPEAQAFTRYGSTPVNLHSGSPDISIPIANLQGREISVPISLTYDASGIKVEQIATWVGLGWNLNVGGMVVRQVNGNPDDYMYAHPSLIPFYSSSSGFASDYDFMCGFSTAENVPTAAGNLQRYFQFLYNVTRTDLVSYKYELQPDTYSFHALGISGTLYIDYALGIAYCMEHPEYKATPTFNEVAGIKNITAWNIVDGAGITYYFELAERTYAYEQGATDIIKDYNSSWLLTRIESVNKRDIVVFNYSSATQWSQPQLAGRGEMRNDRYEEGKFCGYDNTIPAPVPLYKIYQRELTSVSINGFNAAQFTPSSIERKDLKSRKYLASIKIFGESSAVTRRYKFIRSYFGDSTETDEKQVRLRLDGLEVYGDASSTIPQKYSFSYEPGSLPSRESFAQDFWGYFNGASYNQTLIPMYPHLDAENTAFAGADRNPQFSFGKIGSLTKIKYPTGGTTEFTYRANMSSSPVYSVTSNYVPGSLSLQGGRDDNDLFGFQACDPGATNITPKGISGYFYLPVGKGLRVRVIAFGESMPGLQKQFVAIYKVPAHGMRPSNPPFCEVLNGNPANVMLYYGTLSPGTMDYGVKDFPAGHYRMLILNTNPKLTVSVYASGTQVTYYHEVGGQRIESVIDKDDNGIEAGARFYYYDDLSSTSPSLITREFIKTSPQNTGSLWDRANFTEPKSMRKFQSSTGMYVTCESLMRYSSNRVKASNHMTYPVVTEVQFGSPSKDTYNGYTVTEFWDQPDSHIIGFYKPTVLNGRPIRKAVFDRSGVKLNEEFNYYSQHSVGSKIGFELNTTASVAKDTYVVSEVYNQGLGEYYITKDLETATMSSCSWSGKATSLFSDSGFHTCGCNHIGNTCNVPAGSAYPVITTHPSKTYYSTLQSQGKSPVMYHHNTTGAVSVSYQHYNIIYCKNLSSNYQKIPYLFPRYLARTDSTKTITYQGSNAFTTTSINTYNLTTHFQVTQIQTKDSKGDVRQWQNYYPHELQASNPDASWQALLNQNRVAQPVKIEAKYGSPLKTDYTRLDKFKSITATNGTMWVPDVIQFSSSTGTLEDRIKFYQYDNAGNPIEVAKINDSKSSYLWGYSQSLPIAEVKGSAAADFAYTGFEEGSSQGGWTYTISSSTTEFKNGATSHKLSSGSLSRSGLIAGTAYILSYWAKGGTPTVSGGVQTPTNDAPSAESDGWKYFERTVTGITSLTLSAAASPTLYIDEVRLYPKGSLMTTYTYKRGVGRTSATDVTNRMTFFEYDEMGRLKFIRDHDKNVLKQNAYHYRSGAVPAGVN